MAPSSQPATACVPSNAELQDAAIQISRLLRDAKVDAPLRPKVLATLLLAKAYGGLRPESKPALADVNRQLAAALASAAVFPAQRRRLWDALRLRGADFPLLEPSLPTMAHVLAGIDVAHALRGDFDFWGIFYEAFLRYGYDNNALGIVFTPRHITRFCVDLVGVGPEDKVIDIACGTGGFLVPAYERMLADATPPGSGGTQEKGGIVCGFETNATVWALATLNLIFRCATVPSQDSGQAPSGGRRSPKLRGNMQPAGEDASAAYPGAGGDAGPLTALKDGPIVLGSCFDALQRRPIRGRFSRAFLNPPFSQGAEPERDFLDASMETLAPGGLCAVVVKAGLFADEEHSSWRAEFVRRHTVLAVISLPEDLFYPTAAPTSIMVGIAHQPQPDEGQVLVARVWNDGFEKLKNKRVACSGCELPEVKRCFDALRAGKTVASRLAIAVPGIRLKNGNEWSPQEWLPQPEINEFPISSFQFPEEGRHLAPCGERQAAGSVMRRAQEAVLGSVFRAVAEFPDLAESALEDFTQIEWSNLPRLPLGRRSPVGEFFHVWNGKSAGEKHYADGGTPYISSGGRSNSIVRLIEAAGPEVFAHGGLTITAFGQAALQPWAFVARGNGGSSVRVLIPRYRMGVAELAWFAAQINAQSWRFFYGRMAIQSRVHRLVVSSPATDLKPPAESLAAKIRAFRAHLQALSRVDT